MKTNYVQLSLYKTQSGRRQIEWGTKWKSYHNNVIIGWLPTFSQKTAVDILIVDALKGETGIQYNHKKIRRQSSVKMGTVNIIALRHHVAVWTNSYITTTVWVFCSLQSTLSTIHTVNPPCVSHFIFQFQKHWRKWLMQRVMYWYIFLPEYIHNPRGGFQILPSIRYPDPPLNWCPPYPLSLLTALITTLHSKCSWSWNVFMIMILYRILCVIAEEGWYNSTLYCCIFHFYCWKRWRHSNVIGVYWSANVIRVTLKKYMFHTFLFMVLITKHPAIINITDFISKTAEFNN